MSTLFVPTLQKRKTFKYFPIRIIIMKGIIRGIILAGGSGSRLLPVTKIFNKHVIPIGRKLMLEYPLQTLKDSGITDICIALGGNNTGDLLEYFGDGSDFGVHLTYVYQSRAGGIAYALGLCEDFAGGSNVAVILGDNVFGNNGSIDAAVKNFESGGHIFIVKSDTPEKFGVAEIENGKVLCIEEKPKIPKSNHIVTGLYLYDNSVFGVVPNLKPSGRGELEITDVNNYYIDKGKMKSTILDQGIFWSDAGSFETIHTCQRWMWLNDVM